MDRLIMLIPKLNSRYSVLVLLSCLLHLIDSILCFIDSSLVLVEGLRINFIRDFFQNLRFLFFISFSFFFIREFRHWLSFFSQAFGLFFFFGPCDNYFIQTPYNVCDRKRNLWVLNVQILFLRFIKRWTYYKPNQIES